MHNEEYQVRLALDIASTELGEAEMMLDGVAKPMAHRKLAQLIGELEVVRQIEM